ncbi:MAG TPA: response regulator [Candidatus Hydrogenedentes bacterium]|nr:response regulator [Candidatus Hydrogenedentota bacterium]HOS03830.1 response regulator [Candidatus Hydrogenedentota bacterium]
MGLNILIVDDSDTVRAVIAKTLTMCGLPINEVYQAPNGKVALEILAEKWVDLVFSDINMPVMGGVEMIEKMHENDLLTSIPVIVVSTEGSATRMEQLKSKGIRAYLRKPFTPELVRGVVNDIVGLRHENQPE